MLSRAIGVAVLVAVAYVLLGWFAGRGIPAHATAGGIDVGGLSERDARLRLAERATAVESRPVPLRLATTEARLAPGSAGLRVDVEGTLHDLAGFSLSPGVILDRLRGQVSVPLRTSADAPALEAAIRSAAAGVDRPVKEGAVTFPAGTVVTQRPTAGRRVDVGATADAVRANWPADTPIAGVVTEVAPRVDPAVFDVAVKDQAAPAVAGPLTVLADGRRATLTPAQFSPALTMVPDGGNLALRVGAKELVEALRKAAPGLEVAPVDAGLRLENGTPAVQPAKAGRAIDGPASTDAVSRALLVGPRTATLTLADTSPAVTSDQVAGYGVSAEIGRATVGVAGATEAARLANVALAAKKIDGRVVAPGATFSFNEVVGPRTAAAGFAATTTELPGAGKADEGGVGLVASAVYEAAFRGGLTLGQRTSYPVYLPGTSAGLDARVSVGGPDVTFTADPSYGVLVSARVTGAQIEVVLYGRSGVTSKVAAATPTNVVRPAAAPSTAAGCQERGTQPGFDVTVNRVISVDGVESRKDAVWARYAPVPGVTCG